MIQCPNMNFKITYKCSLKMKVLSSDLKEDNDTIYRVTIPSWKVTIKLRDNSSIPHTHARTRSKSFTEGILIF